MFTRDRQIEKWLLEKIVPAYDAMKEDPSRGLSVAEIRAMLEDEHKRATAK